MSKILKLFLNLKLRVKIFISFLVIIVISIILVNYLIFKIYENESKAKAVLLSQNLVEQLASNVSYSTKNFEDSIFLNMLVSDIFSSSIDTSKFIYAKKSSSIFALANSLSNSVADVREIYIENTSNEHYYYNKEEPNRQDYTYSILYTYIRYHYETIKNSWGKPTWISFKDDAGVLYIVRAIIDTDTLQFSGIFGAAIDRSYFKDLYSKFIRTKSGSIAVYNEKMDIISCDVEILDLAEHFRNYLPQNEIELNKYKEFNNKKYIITGSISGNKRWKVLYFISSEEILKDSAKIRFIIIVVCLISAVIALVIAAIISGSVTSNITLLLRKIKSVGQGNFSLNIEPSYHDEVGQLFVEFNAMSGKLNELINRITFEQLEKQKAEYNALQAQINPHFLYNTLETINSIAKIKGQHEIVEIIHSLSHLLRVSISGKKSLVRLRDEIDYVKNYLSIHKVILGDRIQVEYLLDEEVLDCAVPKLILQPIVENAIVHGIEGMSRGGLIIISAYIKEDLLLINVSDNGTGMGREVVDKLLDENEDAENHKPNHTRIGVRSVNRRIKILYGNEFGLKISSEPEKGTVVEIAIPFKPDAEGGV